MRLPEAFVERTKPLLGNEWYEFEQALQEESPVSIRLNPGKNFFLSEERTEAPVPWASDAFYLDSRPSFTLDPLFHAGCYYVQEASSMFLEYYIRKYVKEPVKALDLCAAPGGKTTHLSSILPDGSLLTANEVIRQRANILSENLTKWGNPAVIVTGNDPSDIGKLTGFYDLIVADLPCSGEGMFRKDPLAVSEWSVNHVRLCAERQRRIVAGVWSALKPGGILIYSTCTYNREENENNINWICSKMGSEQLEAPHRFMPHKTRGEGFFIAGLRKNGAMTAGNSREKSFLRRSERSDSGKTAGIGPSPDLKTWLSSPDDFTIFREGNVFGAIPSVFYPDYRLLKSTLKIVSAGVTLGEMKGRDMIPAHALAMSSALPEGKFPFWELDKENALQYLRKEALHDIPSNFPKGYIIVGYRNHPLGFIKNIGARANNLYPPEWRIRMHIPSL
ncbi:MAG: RsmB/NOP family class I SAM-dependent RNA methyltransferase [Dysgonamonadaceae bacterium]|nr:RsmB/NOP family class I SAM-dependent RNA methyltransferase [Dysgonamonadaceae bacterium]